MACEKAGQNYAPLLGTGRRHEVWSAVMALVAAGAIFECHGRFAE